MKLTTQQALQQGVTAHKEGKLQDAERLYRAVLQSQPAHPDANHNLGVIAVSVNKTEAALPLFKTAIESNPKIEQFWLSYINALIKEKRFENAKQVIEQAKKQGVDADRLISLEAQLASINRQETVGSLSPSQQQLSSLLECYQNRRFNDAEKLAISIMQEFPKHQFAWKILGAVFAKTGRKSEAVDANQTAVELSPEDAEAHSNLGNTLQALGRLDEAEASCNQAIALKPDYAEAHSNLGNTLKELGRLDEAEASYTQAIALKPDFAEAHSNLGITLKELGRLDEAEASYTQAIALKPDYAEAHMMLTSMKKFDAQDEQYSKMQELYFNEDIPEEQRCHINFGLAKACEDLGKFEKAFTHYGEGNVLRKKILNYDINQDVELFKQIKSNYSQIAHISLELDKLSKNLMPVFIVGMPRSGTTLVEQIVSSHSQVTGAGELNFVAQFGSEIATGITEANNESLFDFRGEYLDKIQNFSNGNLIITDKMPQNFRFIGLLAAAFPEAKIIHVKRNPAAVCWANYKQYFVSKSIGYCYALDDVISYHKLYENLMEFWANTLSNRIYKLDYEQLTVNQESETRQLIEYLGLDWDENCLSPQNNTRSVATASNVQIRKKVYRGSSEQWKKYQPFLNGAFDGLLS
ncbi:sulfotransferase [Alphaproteobacteria bacterium]|nr:sulfotransferase [Alphaproteobacteria bacterium]